VITRGWARIGIAASAVLLTASATAAQATPPFTATLSADTVAMGEIFDFSVAVPVPSGSVVYFPDTLPTTIYVESAAPVRVDVEPAADGGSRLLLTYPVMAFGVGELPVPGLDILMRARGDQAGVLELPGGSATGAWDEAPRQAGSRVTRIPRQAVWVTPVFTVEQIAEGVEPMPANDVAGGNWSWPSISLMLLCGSLLVGTLVSTTKGLVERAEARRGAPVPPTPEERRARALDDLDALLALGLHRSGRVLEFYDGGSTIVRRYVEGSDGGWPDSLTTTELMRRLRARSGDAVAGALPEAMRQAEVVKFGRLRPGSDDAERHWHVLREWVRASGPIR